MDRIDQLLESYQDEMVQTLRELVRIPSVDGEPKEGMPFGENCAKVLDYALKKAESFGFETLNDENYAGHVAFGGGSGRTLGILAHLDVVPEGEDWTVPPYEAIVKDGYVYGRGSTDNKCSCVSCLYALRAIKEADLKLSDRVLLIMGCNEESGSKDMEHYMSHIGMPDYGFSPDSGFPVCYAEKGIHRIAMTAVYEGESPIVSIEAGNAVNIVPNRCHAVLRGTEEDAQKLRAAAEKLGASCKTDVKDGKIEFEIEGKAAHGAFPAGGRNAVSLMMEALSVLDLGGAQRAVQMLRDTLGEKDWDGKKLNIALEDEPSGPLTVNLGILRADDKGMRVDLDIRQPVTASFDEVLSRVRGVIEAYGAKAESTHISEPLYVPKDSELVTTLMRVYKEITGRDDQPFSMGGGTYARTMKNAVAFGPSLPGSKSCGAHGPDERLFIEEMFTASRIYARTILALAGEKA